MVQHVEAFDVQQIPAALVKVVALLPKGGDGLEVGCNAGKVTAVLFDRATPKTLVLVDPWKEQLDYSSRAFAFAATEEEFATAKAVTLGAFGGQNNVVIHAGLSKDVLANTTENSLDWIYLDGCKYYREILDDLEVSITKLRKGGVLAGAGINWAKQLGFPVKTAVNEICARLGDGSKLTIEDDYFAIEVLTETVVLAPVENVPSYLVLSTMKNEAPFILEWVAHYRAIGFTDFLVFTNDCDDTTDPLLDRLQERDILRHEVNKVMRRGPHKSALKYAQDHVMVVKADWVLICDVDEFLNIKVGDHSVQALLNHIGPQADAIPFPWQIFGCAGIVPFIDEPITDQFTHSEPLPRKGGRKSREVKSMFRKQDLCEKFGLHRPRYFEKYKPNVFWSSPVGDDISERMNGSTVWSMPWAQAGKAAYMNHYPLRSIEAYLIKKNRGRANHVHEDLGIEYFDKWNMSGGRDGTIVATKEQRINQLNFLKSDPATLELHLRGVVLMKQQLAELLTKRVYKRLLVDLRKRANGT